MRLLAELPLAPYAATLRVASTSRSASWESSERLKLSERRSRSSKVAEGSMSSAQRIQVQPRGVSAENAWPVAA